MSLVKLMQIKGSISKDANRKLVKGLLIVAGVMCLFAILAILFALGVFG